MNWLQRRRLKRRFLRAVKRGAGPVVLADGCACECAVSHPGQQTDGCVPAPPMAAFPWVCPPCKHAIRIAEAWAAS